MINTLTLNPAVDRILFLREVRKHITNRVYEAVTTVGGKGTHVSMNLSILGERSRAFGFAYGATGRYILEHLEKSGVEPRFLFAPDRESRTNYLLIEDDNTCTTIAERGVVPSDRELDTLLRDLDSVLTKGDCLVLSGDASNMSAPAVYLRILELIRGKGVRLFLDTSDDMLKESIRHSPFLIKPNRDELAALCGMPAGSDAEVIRAIDSLDAYNIDVVAISLGRDGSIVRTCDGVYKATPPDIPVRNTVGCGDCFLSGLLYGFERGMSYEEMLILASAISSATAASPLSVGFNPAYAEELKPLCHVQKLRG